MMCMLCLILYIYIITGEAPVAKETGEKLIVKWEKMSKSKHNGVDPEKLITEYGIDTVRTTVLKSAAPRAIMMWDEDSKYM